MDAWKYCTYSHKIVILPVLGNRHMSLEINPWCKLRGLKTLSQQLHWIHPLLQLTCSSGSGCSWLPSGPSVCSHQPLPPETAAPLPPQPLPTSWQLPRPPCSEQQKLPAAGCLSQAQTSPAGYGPARNRHINKTLSRSSVSELHRNCRIRTAGFPATVSQLLALQHEWCSSQLLLR